jgi:hypothetical protein
MERKMPHQSLNQLIRKLESVTTLSEDERKSLLDLPVKVKTLAADEDIVREGDRPSQCCLLAEGFLCRYKTLPNGNRTIMAFLCARRNSRCAQPSYRRNGRLVGISWPDLRRHEAASSAVSLVGHNIDARTFYRWLKNNLEFRHRYEEAIAIRERLIPERLWELSFEVTDKNCRSRKTQAQLLEKAIAHINGGRRRWHGRS